jgi:hypothetical protein
MANFFNNKEMKARRKGNISPPISRPDYILLKDVVRRLSEKYPPDWLERDGTRIYAATMGVCFLAALLLAFMWTRWWAFLIPLVGPPLFVRILPRLLFGREPGRPRWAHARAPVDQRDEELIRRIVNSMGPVEQEKIANYCPARTGDRFFKIWEFVSQFH